MTTMITLIWIMGMVLLWIGLGYHLLPFWSVDNSITVLILSCSMFMFMLDITIKLATKVNV